MSKETANKSRRNFTKRLALVASAPILTTYCANSIPTDNQNVEKTLAKSAKGLIDVIQASYGQNINKDDLPKIQSVIERNLTMAEKIRQFKLKNSDEPATIFYA
ncbi:MAG: hypothetical protein HY819_00825 [Acidobacteria bacterium]|nr:hypothetical protein [Acidobacteriota bacterium]